MGKIARIACVSVLAAISQSAVAIPFTFDARSLGMGTVATATADLSTAAWANPAMLTRQGMDDDFSLLVGFGTFIRDDDDLIGDIDDFQDADERREDAIDAGNPGGAISATLDMRRILFDIDGKVIAPEATALFAAGIAFESFSMAVSVRSDVIAGGVVTDLSCSLLEPGCDPSELLSDDFNILNIEGVQATEYAVSFAKDFEIFERRVSVGVKPKVVELRAFTFRESIRTVEAEDSLDNDDNKKDLGSFSTLDIGLAMDLNDNWLLGLSLRNLITDDFDLGNSTLDFDTEATIGIAYRNRFVTLAADYDLIESEPMLAEKSFESLVLQDLKLGVEFNAGDYVFLRAGAAKNVAGGISDGAKDVRYTLGVGFWLGFNLDIAAIVSDHSVGAILQTGFRF